MEQDIISCKAQLTDTNKKTFDYYVNCTLEVLTEVVNQSTEQYHNVREYPGEPKFRKTVKRAFKAYKKKIKDKLNKLPYYFNIDFKNVYGPIRRVALSKIKDNITDVFTISDVSAIHIPPNLVNIDKTSITIKGLNIVFLLSKQIEEYSYKYTFKLEYDGSSFVTLKVKAKPCIQNKDNLNSGQEDFEEDADITEEFYILKDLCRLNAHFGNKIIEFPYTKLLDSTIYNYKYTASNNTNSDIAESTKAYLTTLVSNIQSMQVFIKLELLNWIKTNSLVVKEFCLLKDDGYYTKEELTDISKLHSDIFCNGENTLKVLFKVGTDDHKGSLKVLLNNLKTYLLKNFATMYSGKVLDALNEIAMYTYYLKFNTSKESDFELSKLIRNLNFF